MIDRIVDVVFWVAACSFAVWIIVFGEVNNLHPGLSIIASLVWLGLAGVAFERIKS